MNSRLNIERLAARAQARREAVCQGCGQLHDPVYWEMIDLATGDTFRGTDDPIVALAWGDPAMEEEGTVLIEFDKDGIAYDPYQPLGRPSPNRKQRRDRAKHMAVRRSPSGVKATGQQTREVRTMIARAILQKSTEVAQPEASEVPPST